MLDISSALSEVVLSDCSTLVVVLTADDVEITSGMFLD